jgi:hypothetical protein
MAWQENPDLQRAYKELPGDTVGRKIPSGAKVRKGQSTINKVSEKAQELRKGDPSLTPAQARSRVWETHSDLVEAYQREIS